LVATNEEVKITFRIPGDWEHPGKLIEQIPDGYQLQPESMLLPDGSEVDLDLLPPDEQFFDIFMQSCRTPPSEQEIECVRNYRVNVCLTGPGGSVESAARMMTAAAAIVAAGGAGVFIDNSAVAHAGHKWQELTSDLGIEAITFAYVGIIANSDEVWTMGMHVLGQPDVRMTKHDAEANDHLIIEMMSYLTTRDKPIDDGHVIADLSGPQFKVTRIPAPQQTSNSPLHNPFGQLRLTSLRGIAESN
jgi:hypothetical protein